MPCIRSRSSCADEHEPGMEENKKMELQIDHISKSFKDKRAVDDVSMTLTPGVWGLLGANGAGLPGSWSRTRGRSATTGCLSAR